MKMYWSYILFWDGEYLKVAEGYFNNDTDELEGVCDEIEEGLIADEVMQSDINNFDCYFKQIKDNEFIKVNFK
ncbi:MAG: hypothetical protein ACQESN_08725 [Thermotogota bacterium]